LSRASIEDVQAKDVEHSAQIIRSIVDNEPSPFAEMTLLTVAGGLIVAGVCDGFAEGIELGRESLASGHAREALDSLIAISNA
jgi:anthranilate phosphoribosyltransferase